LPDFGQQSQENKPTSSTTFKSCCYDNFSMHDATVSDLADNQRFEFETSNQRLLGADIV
jgi:hypothetical protein